jgi:putative tryptophan/tyrosine transport system substrate-binding protein
MAAWEILMRRREFIAGLGSAAAWPVVARAQQGAMPVIGYVSATSPAVKYIAAFHRGLVETGFIEGRNVAVQYRFAEGHLDRLPALVADVVRRRVAVIYIADTTASALAAKAATQTIPIVFQVGSDPVEIGLVASLNRPGGNLTGITSLQTAVLAKRLGMLHDLVPTANLIAFLVNPNNKVFAEAETREAQAAARILGVSLLVLNAASPSEIDEAFATLVRERADALLTNSDIYFRYQRTQLAVLAARHAVPAIYSYAENVVAGGLISYGTDYLNSSRQLGLYTGRILKGEKPSDLPVQQVTKIEMVINLKTAKALGITIPETPLATADEVIQ